MKINILIFLYCCFSSSAADFSIHKYENQLNLLEKSEAAALKTLDMKVLKIQYKIFGNYYKALQKDFNEQMKAKNLIRANEINAKKEKISEQYKLVQGALKIGPPVKETKGAAKVSFLTKKDVYYRGYSSSSTETVKLKIGGVCFKKGGAYLGDETWKSIPDFLIGTQISFLSHDSDSNSGSAYYRSSEAGYIYYVTSGNYTLGALRVGEMKTSAGRRFNIYKYYLQKSVTFYFSMSKSSESFAITSK